MNGVITCKNPTPNVSMHIGKRQQYLFPLLPTEYNKNPNNQSTFLNRYLYCGSHMTLFKY
jgi:hypothetical protein